MKIALITSLMCVVYSLEASREGCGHYSCKTSNPAFQDESVCLARVTNSDYTQYYGRECKSKYSCDTESNDNGLSFCIPVTPSFKTDLGNGVKCNYNVECNSNNCFEGICEKDPSDISCESSSQCDAGYYCKGGDCIPLIREGSGGCESNDECVFGAGCYKSSPNSQNSVCIPLFSMVNGNKTISNTDINGGFEPLCKSRFAFLSAADNAANCTSPPKSTRKIPMKCASDDDCTGINSDGFKFTSSCECGFNPTGQSYCSLFAGDAPYVDYYKKLQKWMTGSEGSNCNRAISLSNDCIESWWSSHDASEFIYYGLKARDYSEIEGTDDCIQELYVNTYKAAADKASFAGVLLVALGFIFN